MPGFRLLDPPWRLPVTMTEELSTLAVDVRRIQRSVRKASLLPIGILLVVSPLVLLLPHFFQVWGVVLVVGMLAAFAYPAWVHERDLKRACKALVDGQYNVAAEALAPVADSWPVAQYLRGLAALHGGEPEVACPMLETLAPVNLQALYYAGLAHLLAGRLAIGWQFLHTVAEIDPRHLEARYYRGVAAIANEHPETAVEDFQAAAARAPRRVLPLEAYALRAAKRPADALETLHRLQALTPDDPWPALQSALLLAETMKFDDCEGVLQKLPTETVESKLVRGFAAFYLSLSLGRTGHADAAHAALQRSQATLKDYLSQRPSDLVAWTRVAMGGSVLREHDSVIDAATHMLELAPAEELSLRILALQLRAGANTALADNDAAQMDRMEAASLIVQLPAESGDLVLPAR